MRQPFISNKFLQMVNSLLDHGRLSVLTVMSILGSSGDLIFS